MASVIASGWKNCRQAGCLTGAVWGWCVLSQVMLQKCFAASAFKNGKNSTRDHEQAKNNADNLHVLFFLTWVQLNMAIKTQNTTLRSVSC